MSHHTSMSNCLFFILVITALSIITDCLTCTEYLCISNKITAASVYELAVTFTFSHLADAFIQSDLQLGST